MKTNIIHVLIIAIILIAGWSLFTVLQDFYNTDTSRYRNYSVVGKSMQYLPLNPQNYSGLRKYPVYKPSTSRLEQDGYSGRNSNLSLNIDNDERYAVNEINYDLNVGNKSVQIQQINKRTSQSNPGSVSKRPVSQMMRPFTKSMSTDATRKIADASLSSSSATTGSTSEGSGMMRVFGNEEEGDAIEGGGGIDNQDFYNDVPVGDGTFLLVIMALLYSIYITMKFSGRISVKKNN